MAHQPLRLAELGLESQELNTLSREEVAQSKLLGEALQSLRFVSLPLILLAMPALADKVMVEGHEVPFQMKDGRMLVKQADLAPALPDLEDGDEVYDLLDILKRHPDLRATKRDGRVTAVRYYPRADAEAYRQAHPYAEQQREPQRTYRTKKTKPKKTSWRNESAFSEGEYKPSIETGGGRITNERGEIVSSSAEDKRQGKYASQKEYEMSTHKTGRHTRPNVIYINGYYKEGHYYVPSEDETRGQSKEKLGTETHTRVETTPVSPVIDKKVPVSDRYYIPVEELGPADDIITL